MLSKEYQKSLLHLKNTELLPPAKKTQCLVLTATFFTLLRHEFYLKLQCLSCMRLGGTGIHTVL